MRIQSIQKQQLVIYSLTVTAILLLLAFILPSKVDAATIEVVAGTDSIAVDSNCTLSEAIDNINNQAVNNADCAAGDGNEDTIVLPEGTITLSDDLPTITESVIIEGQGMDSSVIDGDNGQYRPFTIFGQTISATLSDFKVIGALRGGLLVATQNATVSRVEIDGSNALADASLGGIIGGLYLQGNSIASANFSVSDLYIHSFDTVANSGTYGFLSTTASGNEIDLDIQRVTIADLNNSSLTAGVNGFFIGIGGAGPPSHGTIDADITNVTVDNLTSSRTSVGFGAAAIASSGTASVNLNVTNVSLTRVIGEVVSGLPSMGFYSIAGGADVSDTGNANINSQNVLISDNTSSGNPSNCHTFDYNVPSGGTGTSNPTITSLGHNISGDSTCISFTENGDQQNVSNVIETLGILSNNGGITPTRALLPGSPAIGAGAAVLGVSTDQRGITRPSNPDVGAYQTVLGDTITASPTANENDGLAETGTNIALVNLLPLILLLTSLVFARKWNSTP